MKRMLTTAVLAVLCTGTLFAQAPPAGHPDTSEPGWMDVFQPDLSNASFPEGVWTVEDGVFTASEDQAIWTDKEYENYVLDLEFKTAPGTNSGVIVHASDKQNWIPNSIEIQIADNFHEEWANSPATWQNAAFFGRKPAEKDLVKKPGEWNRYTITSQDGKLSIVLNGELVNEMDMSLWTSATTNPDGTEIPAWLNKPAAELPAKGFIGFQGKHAGAPVWFRNIKIKELE